MRVVIAAAGSRGDAVPFGALASRLVSAGHEVTVVTHAALTDALPDDLDVRPVASDPDALLAGPAGRAMRRGNLAALNRSRHHFADFLTSFVAPTREALTGADVLVASTFVTPAVDEAMRQGVPVVRGHLWPEFTALDGPMPLLPYAWRLPGPVRRGTRGALRAVEPFFAGVDGEWKDGRLDLRAHHPAGLTTSTLGSLHAYSPLVEPAVEAGADVTGWWRTTSTNTTSTGAASTGAVSARTLSAGTADLLDSGDRWVVVGFGSMRQSDPRRIVESVAQACRRVGMRALLQLDGAEADASGLVVPIGPEPHDALFPHAAAVVHHGGSGTTGTAVAAGVPSVVVPHLADQYHWAHRLDTLGVAPAPLPRRLLTARSLASRLERALQPATARRAAELGRLVAAEDGTGRAVAALERMLAGESA